MNIVIFFSLVLSFLATCPVPSNPLKVNSIASLQQAINSAGPGDLIIVAKGVYTTSESILISKKGNASQPIIIEAESTGSVEIKGTNGFVISSAASYIIIKGFRFTHKTGTNRIEPGATHCLITRNVFECAPVNSGSRPYLNVSGDDNEVSFNTFQNKTDEGQMI